MFRYLTVFQGLISSVLKKEGTLFMQEMNTMKLQKSQANNSPQKISNQLAEQSGSGVSLQPPEKSLLFQKAEVILIMKNGSPTLQVLSPFSPLKKQSFIKTVLFILVLMPD